MLFETRLLRLAFYSAFLSCVSGFGDISKSYRPTVAWNYFEA